MHPFHRTFASEAHACAWLLAQGFAWNKAEQRYERGEQFLSLVRAYVGQTKTKVWTIQSC